MNSVESVVLGVIQGLTEFLPISSSGHLVIFQNLFGLKEANVGFDISVHIGTLMAVVIYFWEDIQSMIITLCRFLCSLHKRTTYTSSTLKDPDMRFILMIVVGSIPTAIIGLLFYQIVDQLFSSVVIVGIMLFVTGLLLWLTRMIKTVGRDIELLTIRDALVIGIVQGMAILPGISRSGSTIAVGLFLGISRGTAAKYSFLLSLPAILGAGLLMIKDIPNDPHFSLTITFIGTMTSCIVGYLSLKLLVFIINRGNLHFFTPYCWIVGFVSFWL